MRFAALRADLHPIEPRSGSSGAPGLRRKDECLSFPFPAVETAGYYQSSPAGTQAGVSVWEELPDAALDG